MEGMENSNGNVAAAADNEFQLVTNQDGTFAGYTRKRKNNYARKVKTDKVEDEKEKGDDDSTDMPPKAKKLFNLD